MGMYDNVSVSKKFLPNAISEHTEDWQTKSHDKLLNLLTIKDDGKLYINNTTIDNLKPKDEAKFLSYTGEIRFYNNIEEVWWEFVAFFEKGILLKCIQVMPE